MMHDASTCACINLSLCRATKCKATCFPALQVIDTFTCSIHSHIMKKQRVDYLWLTSWCHELHVHELTAVVQDVQARATVVGCEEEAADGHSGDEEVEQAVAFIIGQAVDEAVACVSEEAAGAAAPDAVSHLTAAEWPSSCASTCACNAGKQWACLAAM